MGRPESIDSTHVTSVREDSYGFISKERIAGALSRGSIGTATLLSCVTFLRRCGKYPREDSYGFIRRDGEKPLQKTPTGVTRPSREGTPTRKDPYGVNFQNHQGEDPHRKPRTGVSGVSGTSCAGKPRASDFRKRRTYGRRVMVTTCGDLHVAATLHGEVRFSSGIRTTSGIRTNAGQRRV